MCRFIAVYKHIDLEAAVQGYGRIINVDGKEVQCFC